CGQDRAAMLHRLRRLAVLERIEGGLQMNLHERLLVSLATRSEKRARILKADENANEQRNRCAEVRCADPEGRSQEDREPAHRTFTLPLGQAAQESNQRV